jgi:hypothetical protein
MQGDGINVLESDAGCTLNAHKTGEGIRELNTFSLNKIAVEYKCK